MKFHTRKFNKKFFLCKLNITDLKFYLKFLKYENSYKEGKQKCSSDGKPSRYIEIYFILDLIILICMFLR